MDGFMHKNGIPRSSKECAFIKSNAVLPQDIDPK
jgi:hypothetical protein